MQSFDNNFSSLLSTSSNNEKKIKKVEKEKHPCSIKDINRDLVPCSIVAININKLICTTIPENMRQNVLICVGIRKVIKSSLWPNGYKTELFL
jgi:hypothetical protein